MKKIIWGTQIVFALLFLMAGGMKVATPQAELKEKMAWVEDFSSFQVKSIGAIEVVGAIGVILPAATGIMPVLSIAAPAGLALTMVGAAIVHANRGEMRAIPINLILLAVAVFVAYGRNKYFKSDSA